jgi:hypothetical protein
MAGSNTPGAAENPPDAEPSIAPPIPTTLQKSRRFIDGIAAV